METPNPLATDSFSYSWLVTEHHTPNSPPHKTQSFDFDLHFAPPHLPLAHADEIFENGHIIPSYTPLKSPNSAPQSPVSGHPTKKGCFLFAKWKKSKILRKYCTAVLHLLHCTRKSIRVDDLERKVCEVKRVRYENDSVKSWTNSPRVSPARSSNAWCVDEISVHEAILYCKRSIGHLEENDTIDK